MDINEKFINSEGKCADFEFRMFQKINKIIGLLEILIKSPDITNEKYSGVDELEKENELMWKTLTKEAKDLENENRKKFDKHSEFLYDNLHRNLDTIALTKIKQYSDEQLEMINSIKEIFEKSIGYVKTLDEKHNERLQKDILTIIKSDAKEATKIIDKFYVENYSSIKSLSEEISKKVDTSKR